MIIKASSKDYEVTVNNNFDVIEKLQIDKDTYVVIDKKLYNIYVERLFNKIPKDQLYIFESIEENKTIESALQICEIMTNIPAKRNAKLISFGGGIVQDVTGFVANVLYRGIHWTFYPPDQIQICTPFFKSLSEKDFESGLGEVVKFNVMYGEKGIKKVEENINLLLARDEKTLEEFVYNSLAFKKAFIEQDEFDRGIRIHLNYAHTFGHAFETMSNYVIPHGTAVAMGMIVANRISLMRGWLKESIVNRIENVIWKIIHVDIQSIPMNMDVIMAAIRKDKKQTSTDLTAVLMKPDMSLLVVHDVKTSEIKTAITYLFDNLRRK